MIEFIGQIQLISEDYSNGKVHHGQKNGLKYELAGDYYFLAGDDEPEERRPIGIWGCGSPVETSAEGRSTDRGGSRDQRYLRYLRRCKKATYTALLIEGKLPDYLADVNDQSEEMLFQLVKQMARDEGVDEALKRQNQMVWVQRMNSIRNRSDCTSHCPRRILNMKKYVIALLLIVFCVLSVSSCSHMEYDEQDFLGKTSLQIESQYGQFDNIRAPADISGIYRNCGCGYIVVKEKMGLFGTTPAKYYMIYFDENGVAYKCALENGGIGG